MIDIAGKLRLIEVANQVELRSLQILRNFSIANVLERRAGFLALAEQSRATVQLEQPTRLHAKLVARDHATRMHQVLGQPPATRAFP